MPGDLTLASEPLLLTERQTADLLQVCPKTVWTLAKTGQLQSIKIGAAKRYDRRDVLAFIERSKAPVTATADGSAAQ